MLPCDPDFLNSTSNLARSWGFDLPLEMRRPKAADPLLKTYQTRACTTVGACICFCKMFYTIIQYTDFAKNPTLQDILSCIMDMCQIILPYIRIISYRSNTYITKHIHKWYATEQVHEHIYIYTHPLGAMVWGLFDNLRRARCSDQGLQRLSLKH